MLAECPENDALFIGAERLGRLVGRSDRWIRERATLNGVGAVIPTAAAERVFG